MRSFGAATGHVLVGRDAGQPISAFQASTRHSRKLSKFEPRLFPPTPLRLNGSGDGDIEYVSSEVAGEFNMTIKRAAPLLKYTLVPKTQRGWSEGTVNSPQPLTDLNIDAEAEEHFNTACTDDVLRLRDALIAAKDSCESERIDCDADSISSNDPAALLLRCPSNSIVFLGKSDQVENVVELGLIMYAWQALAAQFHQNTGMFLRRLLRYENICIYIEYIAFVSYLLARQKVILDYLSRRPEDPSCWMPASAIQCA
jgi:hypothetical protein